MANLWRFQLKSQNEVEILNNGCYLKNDMSDTKAIIPPSIASYTKNCWRLLWWCDTKPTIFLKTQYLGIFRNYDVLLKQWFEDLLTFSLGLLDGDVVVVIFWLALFQCFCLIWNVKWPPMIMLPHFAEGFSVQLLESKMGGKWVAVAKNWTKLE